jgi:hypothetical protein
VLVACDGRAAYADYACPLAGRCVFWNTSEGAWSGAGCRTLVSEAGDVTCLASHLTDFSTITEALDYTRVGQHAARMPRSTKAAWPLHCLRLDQALLTLALR